MAERRSLKEGLKPASNIERTIEEQFVYGGKAKDDEPAPTQTPPASPPEPREVNGQGSVSRSPFTTRLRADFATALKRASLERQLKGQFPNTLQDILEEALEPWLRANGYIT